MISFLRQRIFLGCGAAVLAVCLVGGLAWRSAREQAIASAWVAHTHAVMTRLLALQSFVGEVEMGSRGFLLTGQPRDLEILQAAGQSLGAELLNLRELTRDNPQQQARLSLFEPIVRERVRVAEAIAALARQGRADEAARLLQSAQLQYLRAEIRRVLAEALAQEENLLRQRNARMAARSTRTGWALAGGTTLALLLLSGAAWHILRDTFRRQRVEMQLRRAHEEMEERVAARMREIHGVNLALQEGIAERQRVEEELQRAHQELEARVAERTEELAEVNEGLQREVAERRKITEALKNSRALYHSLIENLPVAVWRIDLDGRFTFGNEHLCDCLGVAEEEFLGRCDADFYQPEVVEKFRADDRRVIETGDPFEDIEECATLSGQRGWRHVLKTPLLDPAGNLIGVQGISWDVTERKLAEEEMRRIQAELERKNQDLGARNEEIQNFYHTLSHELKTPLTSAREFVSIVLDGLAGPLTDTQREYLTIARQSCNQLRVCINDLLDATRLETGKLSLERKPASLADLVQRVVTIMTPAAAEKRIALEAELQPGLPEVPMDENRIVQVVNNLLTNALKFTPEGGRIGVRVGEVPGAADHLQVTVSDTGPGIEKDHQARIFDRLYQIKTGDAATDQGVGLGLYICRELVALHGGHIRVESEPGQGCTFTFTLPCRPAPRPPSLLIVDDDPTFRDLLGQILRRANYDVTTADGGQSALEAMAQRLPDLVVLDLHMPGLDGSATLREIRRHWPALPVILHTGFPEGELMDRAAEAVPFTLLNKPCAPQQLIDTIGALTRRAGPPPLTGPPRGALPAEAHCFST